MSSPRIMMKNGQFVFFCCNDCMMKFFLKPGKYIIGAGPTASDFQRSDLNNNQNMNMGNTISKDNDSDDKAANSTTALILAIIFSLLCVENILLAWYFLIFKKRLNAIPFFNIESAGVDEDDNITVKKKRTQMNNMPIVVEKYTDV